jgi:hypothetical protein
VAATRVLDANILLDLALFRFADQLEPGPLKLKASSKLTIVKSTAAFDRLMHAAQLCRAITTHLILAEVGRKAREFLWPKEISGDRSRTWPFLEALRGIMVDLKLSIADLPSATRDDLRHEFGPTDADLVAITLAYSREPGGATLLTADGPLARWCKANDVPCEHYDRVAAALE